MSKTEYIIHLPQDLLQEAKKFDLNIQKIIEKTLQEEIKKRKQWLEENKDSLNCSNEFFFQNGNPISKKEV